MKDFILDAKIMLVAVIVWVALGFYVLIAHVGSPLVLLAQSVDIALMVRITFRAWKRGM